MKHLVLLLLGALIATSAAAKSITVTLRAPGSLGNELVNATEQWSDVTELTVIGSLNGEDMGQFSKLTFMTRLDLSQTDIKSISGCAGLDSLRTVVLPSTVTEVNDGAFSGTRNLSSINLPEVLYIGNEAFEFSGLTELDLPKVKEIYNYAFRETRLSRITCPSLEYIGNNAFDYTPLRSFEAPTAKSIGSGAFQYCEYLTNVVISDDCTVIPYNCFYCCTNLKTFKFPSALTKIESSAFYGTSLTEAILPERVTTIENEALASTHLTKVSIPASIEQIDYSAFENTHELAEISCFAITPTEYSGFGSSNSNSTLYVPAMSVAAYRLSEGWSHFQSVQPLDTTIEDIHIFSRFNLFNTAGIAENPNLTVTGEGHLTINSEKPLNWNKFIWYNNLFNGTYYHNQFDRCTSVIAQSEMTVNDVEVHLSITPDTWNFISFPFDVKVSDIRMPDETVWVVRKYSGEDRANLTGNTWQNMTEDTWLRAGEGYIFQFSWIGSEHNYGKMGEMTVSALKNEKTSNIFKHEDASVALAEYASEFAHNRSWNLIGNPYPAYFDIRSLNFTAPVTVWTSSGYRAVSPVDDNYIFHPNEAFFVQKPDGMDALEFVKDGRTHKYDGNAEDTRAPGMAISSDRKVFNFSVSGNGFSDRARLVINPEAKAGYEMERDAAKFMSSNADVPQIFMHADGVDYAIMECPASEEAFVMGFHAGADGEYTISLETAADARIILIDNETGISTDLAENDYNFVAVKGSNDRRFSIIYGGDTTGIEAVEAIGSKADSKAFNIKGQRVAADAEGLIIVKGKKVLNK